MIDALRMGLVLPANLLLLRRYPVSLVHFVTERCQAACAQCFISPERRRLGGNELTLDEIARLTRHTGPCLLNVNLTGGEPFLRADLADIAGLYVANAGVRSVYVTTNASKPDRVLAFAAVMRRWPRCTTTLSLSLDDLPAHHDRQRGLPGLADRVLETYRALLAAGSGIQAMVNMTIFEDNADRAMEVYRHFRDQCGIRQLAFGPARDQGVYRAAPAKRQRIHAAYRAVLTEFRRDQAGGRMAAGATDTLAGRLLDRKNGIVHRLMDRELLEGRHPDACLAGRLFGVIAADGSVYPCELRDRSLGNLREVNGDLMALWHGPRARDEAKAIRRCAIPCAYECAWTVNVLARSRHWWEMAGAANNEQERP